jgi:hypothetical protein
MPKSINVYFEIFDLELPCNGERKNFKCEKTQTLWLKLHKKKCECCRNSDLLIATNTASNVRNLNQTQIDIAPTHLWDSIHNLTN